MLLARKLHFNVTMAQTARTPTSAVGFKAVDSGDGLIEVDELDIAVQGLACDTLHDDVDWLIIILSDNFSVTAEECEDLGAVDRIWNLQSISVASKTQG
jgi:hypothetical protein